MFLSKAEVRPTSASWQIQTFALRSSCTARSDITSGAGRTAPSNRHWKASAPSGRWRPGRPDETCATLMRMHTRP
jgi:hypothetical protein